MKRFLLIPVMLIYTLAISGVNIYAHYCGKHLASWSVTSSGDGCGDVCDDSSKPVKPKKHKCCHDKVVEVKLKADHHHETIQTAFLTALYTLPLSIKLPTYDGRAVAVNNLPDAAANRSNAPPGPWQQIPLYKLHSRLTYYG